MNSPYQGFLHIKSELFDLLHFIICQSNFDNLHMQCIKHFHFKIIFVKKKKNFFATSFKVSIDSVLVTLYIKILLVFPRLI